MVRRLRFDDGSGAVPGGLDGPVERVVVIGAGVAGITAANALSTAGVDCVVLEGRDRVGGRIRTVEIGGGCVDLGAAWIHHPVGNPISRLAEAAGIDRMSGDFRAEAVFFDPTDASVASPPRRQVDAVITDFLVEVDRLGLGPDATAEQAVLAHLTGRGLEPWALNALRTMVEAEGSGAMAEMAVGGFPPSTLEYEGSSLGDFPIGGYARVIEALRPEVRNGAEVVSAAFGPQGVEVGLADGTSEEGSHALITVPLGVLQAGTIEFRPSLPDEKSAAISRLGFGRFEKIALAFDEPVGVGRPHLYPIGEQEFRVVLAMERFTGRSVVVATAFGSSAGLLVDTPDDQVIPRLLSHLRRAWGPVPEPVEIVRSSWAIDPFSRGAYSFVPPGATRRDFDRLGEPVGGRVLFAGEATGSARVGFVDGAFSTAIREAKRLLGQPTVELTVG